MRGGYIHRLLTNRIAEAATAAGLVVDAESFVPPGRRRGFVDLLVRSSGPTPRALSIEVELSAARVELDLDKARALGVEQLWIVVPSRRVLVRVARRVWRLDATGVSVHVLLYSHAIQKLALRRGIVFPLESGKENRPGLGQTLSPSPLEVRPCG